MRRCLVGFLLVLLPKVVWAQLPSLRLEHLTTREGLPSNEVWCLNKDRQGFLWIGTGRSICRYDGYSFLRLDSLKLGYCSGVSFDSTGNIYASIDTRGLCRINAKTLTVTTLQKNNYDDNDPGNDLHEQVTVDAYNQAWVCDYNSVKRYDPATGQLHRYNLSAGASGGDAYQYSSFFEDHQHTLWVISEVGLYRYHRAQDKLVCVLGPEASLPKNRIPIRLCKASADAQGNLWIGGYDYGLIRFSPVDQSFTVWKTGFDHSNVACAQESVDENGRKMMVVGTDNGVSIFYPDRAEVYHLPEFYKSGIQVKDMYNDRDNGILWIGTRDGIYKYRYRNVGIRTIDIPPTLVRLPVQVTCLLPTPTGTMLLGLSHSGVLAWEPQTNRFRFQPYPVSALTQQLRWIQNRPFAFTDKGVFVGNPKTGRFQVWEPASRLFKYSDFRDGLLDRKGRLWIANLNEGLKVVDPVSGQPIALWSDDENRKLLNPTFVKVILEGIDGRIWVATCTKGLYFFDEVQHKFINIQSLPGNKGLILGGECINGMQQTPDGSILIASWGGVSKISATGQILHSFEFKTADIRDTYCVNIAEDRNGHLWFSTNEGIHIADPATRKIRYLTTIEGLHSNSPVGFYYNGRSELLLGHTNAISRLNIDQLNDRVTLPRIALSSVDVKNKPVWPNGSEELVLQPDENAITFNFSALNFEPATKNHYQYQLLGSDTSWVDLGEQHMLAFTNLHPDAYQLNIKSSNGNGLWSAHPLAIRFRVNPHFTATWWFRTLIGLLIGGIVVAVMRWRVATLDERNRLDLQIAELKLKDLQIAELKLKALQSQMNPHFLFNSLNSVQNYLLTNRGIEGARYLSKFSKLVRRIMENSNHQYLRFEQIIETLQMYVEIESLRFNQEFHYTFTIADDDTLLNAMLPPMLLQPYVENAIWHGLMPKEGDKTLTISACIEQDHIHCIVEDNGVGRRAAPHREGHISRGQEITKGIFESLHRKDHNARLEIIDLIDATGCPAGTRVEMTIPIEKG
ncbi:two-component regulator propeller domain-containing protein [Spirosoma gilvum]